MHRTGSWRNGVAAGLLALLLPGCSADATQGASAAAGPATRAVRASLDKIAARDAEFRAVIAVAEAQALQDAAAQDALPAPQQNALPLRAVPILLKDNIEARHLATTAGSLALANNRTGRDAPLVAQLRAAGAIILGKANLSEWANFRSNHPVSGWSAVGGQTRNAHDPARSPCGSSAGSAVAVALDYVDVAIGTETSGSIVCPAALNGVVGFKPSHGIVSGDGIVPLASTQDVAGPIADSVALAATTLSAMLDPAHPQSEVIAPALLDYAGMANLNGVRIGVLADTQGYDLRRDAILARALARAQAQGAVVVPDLSLQEPAEFGAASGQVLLYEFRRDLNRYLKTLPGAAGALDLDALIAFNEAHAEQELAVFDQSTFIDSAALKMSEEEYAARLAMIHTAAERDGYERLFSEHRLDAVIGITDGPAWMIDHVNGDAWFGPGMAAYAAVGGYPHITIPMGDIRGLPIGVSLVGKRYADAHIARIAYRLENRQPVYSAPR